ncbi:hypothetical protein AVEN_234499-1 [Araneus ventricosus]|uniref:Uncharacterized protein n=1 Tax=Araneus ventricosus TaxID=182803 RepID=A0A4Y2A8X0_ARAVE|nr:hypothetical protein AVEN_234499-1 [Araneus ventricosus]
MVIIYCDIAGIPIVWMNRYSASLSKLHEAIQSKQLGMFGKGLILLQGSARINSIRQTRNLTQSFGSKIHTGNDVVYESLWPLVTIFQQRRFQVLGVKKPVSAAISKASQMSSIGFSSGDLTGHYIWKISLLSKNSSSRWTSCGRKL